MRKIIDISTTIGTDIRTRSRIRQLTEHIDAAQDYDIDFSNVEFISRSFADELISFVDSSDGRINCVHMPQHISELLDIVRRNRNVHVSTRPMGDVIKLETEEQMEAFFNAF